MLRLRQQLARSSVKKYTAMEYSVCRDSRVRGMFQFYGANRTGRFAGRMVQLQNLPQNHMPDLAQARALIRSGDFETLKLLYDDIPDTLSQLIRTAFIPMPGMKFYVADFSAIEARVIAWFAGEQWRSEVFKNGGDIYCASASQMFHVPVVKHGVNGHLRQKGKIAELALGYGGSVGALKAMGAIEMGLQEEELQPLVDAWRKSNPNIVRFWRDVDAALKKTVKEKTATECRGIRFTAQSGMLFITLPSGRRLAYVKPRMGENRFGGESVTYEGVSSTKKWERIETTIFPEYDWVMNILGDKATNADVTMLLDNGVDLHSFQPTADDIIRISRCDLFIYVGGESDEWVEDALKEATNKDMLVINLLESLGNAVKEEELKEGMEAEEHEHEHEEDHGEEAHDHDHEEEAEYDEHVWLS